MFLDFKRLVHLIVDQELGEKQDIPHAQEWQQQQSPRGEQHEDSQISQLQNTRAQDPPEIFDTEQQAVAQPDGRLLPEQHQLRPVERIDDQHHQHGDQIERYRPRGGSALRPPE